MSVQNLSGVEAMLQQMRAVVREAAGGAAPPSGAHGGGFAAELQRSVRRVSDAQNVAQAQARAYQMGEPGVSLNDVMIDLQKAGVAFQATIQVRNRLVAAYQEIASMPV